MHAAFLWKWEWICPEILCLVSWPDLSWDFDRKPLVKLSIHFKFNYKNNGIFTLIGQWISLLTFRGNWRSSQGKARQGRNGLQHSSHRGKARSWLHKPVGAPTSGSRRLYKVQRQYHGIPGNPRRYQTIDSRRFSSYVQSRHSCALADEHYHWDYHIWAALEGGRNYLLSALPLPRTLLGSSHWNSALFRAPPRL